MNAFNQTLLVLHFLGLAMGFSVSAANIVMAGLMAKSTPAECLTFGRFPPVMSRVGDIGLVILWVTGATMLYTKWGGIGSMPWQFHAKLTAVLLLTLTVGYIHSLQRLIRGGDAAAAARLQTVGKFATLFALIAVIFAVLTFD